jgi:hypothetical protein
LMRCSRTLGVRHPSNGPKMRQSVMSTRFTCLGAALFAAFLGPVERVNAQGVSADIWLGMRYASADNVKSTDEGAAGVVGGVTATWARRAIGRGHLIVGASASLQTSFERCPAITVSGECAGDVPNFYAGSALLGWEVRRGARGASLRVLAGPGAYFSQDRVALGATTQLDVATPQVGRAALFAFAQTAYVPAVRGTTYRLHGLGLGVRVRQKGV